jgi:hypothetical protein
MSSSSYFVNPKIFIMHAIDFFSDGQLGFIYIQPRDTRRLYLRRDVKATLEGLPGWQSWRYFEKCQIFPPTYNTNFQINFRDRQPDTPDDPREHTEYRLLRNHGLERMVHYTKRITQGRNCPTYVSFHSTVPQRRDIQRGNRHLDNLNFCVTRSTRHAKSSSQCRR